MTVDSFERESDKSMKSLSRGEDCGTELSYVRISMLADLVNLD